MSVTDLFNYLESNGIDEIGIADPIDRSSEIFSESMSWIQRQEATNCRTFWFRVIDGIRIPKPPKKFLSRWIPMNSKKHAAWIQTSPFPALLLKRGTPPFSERKFLWTQPYSKFGSMVEVGEFDEWVLWVWKPMFPLRRALLFCHHCAVLPDIQRQLRILGIRGDFVWIADEKPPLGDAIPSKVEGFTDSTPLRWGSYDDTISDSYAKTIRENYSMVFTSHCMRYPLLFMKTGLPIYHVNSTRFGNETTLVPDLFEDLCKRLQVAINSTQLRIIHNNEADKWYAYQYLGDCLKGSPVIQSLCCSALRFRIEPPAMTLKKPFLLWDTRFHITEGKGSKTIKEIALKLDSICDITSVLSKEIESLLDDSLLETYQAIIHVPYNISTMSCFEQSAAGVPIWIPTAEYLERILLDPEEHSEMSWYCFHEEIRGIALWPDQVWKPECIREFIKRSDFYNGALNTVFYFDSVEDLVSKIQGADYRVATEQAFVLQGTRRLKNMEAYALAINHL